MPKGRRRAPHYLWLCLSTSFAGFQVLGQAIGLGTVAGVGGILLANVIILAAILIELVRGEGVHPVYRWVCLCLLSRRAA